MSGEGVTAIIGFTALQVAQVFYMLDTIMFGDTTFSILDVFIAIMFLELIIGYVMRVITSGKSGFGTDEESTGGDISDPEAYSSEGFDGEMRYPTK